MGGKRRRKSGGSPKVANVTASTPDQTKSKKQRNEDGTASILSHNKFSVLSEGGTETNVSNLNGFGETQEQDDSPRAVNLPPLMVKSIALDKLKRDLMTLHIKAEFKICRIGIKVVLCSKDGYDRAKAYLNQAKAEYFTFDIPSEKPFKAVIRGLPIMAPEDIKSDLISRYKIEPLAVFPMKRHSGSREYRDCLYLVHFRKGSVSLGALKAARVIQDIIVSWEGYRGANKDVTQCMRCLNFGHGTRNCRLSARCNICSQPHATDSCPIDGAVPDKCANCGGPHRSTDRSCKKREEYKNIRKQASTSNQPGRRRDRAPPVNQENYPPLLKQQPAPPARWVEQSSRTPRPFSPDPASLRQQTRFEQSSRTTRPFSPDPASPRQQNPDENQPDDVPPLKYTPAALLQILNEMCDKLQQCSTRLEQVRLIGNLVLTYGF